MRSAKSLVVAIPLAALAIAGCGGGGGDTTASQATTEVTPSLSRTELISQGDAICAEVNAAVGSVGAAETAGSSQATQVADLYAGMVESLKRLGKPEGEDAGYTEFIGSAEMLAKVEGEAKLAAEREDTAAIEAAAAKTEPALEAFQSAASAYGFEDCSEGPSVPTPTAPSGGAEAGEEAPEGSPEAIEEEIVPEVEEEAVPETGGAEEEAAPEGGGTGAGGGGGETGGSSGGIGPG